MALRGLYKWAMDGDAADSPVPETASPAVGNRPVPMCAEDLVFEKKRLQLVGLDPEKFDYFFEKYYDQIFRFAFWRTGDYDEAVDVACETFAVAWDRRAQFRWQGYSFGAWLFQIARSVLSHEQRDQQVRGEVPYEPGTHDRPDEKTPADELARKNDQEVIRQCLARLSPAQHEVLVLNHFMGLTTRQIAVVIEKPLGTVNSHLRRGKRALQRNLAECGEAGGLSTEAMRIVRQAAIEDSGLMIMTPEEK